MFRNLSQIRKAFSSWTPRRTSGKVVNNSAIFVSAPVATSHADCAGHDIKVSRISLMALQCDNAFLLGCGSKSVPSSPLSPCIAGACFSARQNGFAAPGKTWMSSLAIAVNTLNALFVVLTNEALP